MRKRFFRSDRVPRWFKGTYLEEQAHRAKRESEDEFLGEVIIWIVLGILGLAVLLDLITYL